MSASFKVTINSPGLPGHVETGFGTIRAAWEWIATEREWAEGILECPRDTCPKALRLILSQDRCGSVHLHTPGSQARSGDTGLIYSVDPMI